MNKGDLIKCHDTDDLIKTMRDLARAGIDTDFYYEKEGFWLEVIGGTEDD